MDLTAEMQRYREGLRADCRAGVSAWREVTQAIGARWSALLVLAIALLVTAPFVCVVATGVLAQGLLDGRGVGVMVLGIHWGIAGWWGSALAIFLALRFLRGFTGRARSTIIQTTLLFLLLTAGVLLVLFAWPRLPFVALALFLLWRLVPDHPWRAHAAAIPLTLLALLTWEQLYNVATTAVIRAIDPDAAIITMGIMGIFLVSAIILQYQSRGILKGS